MKIFSKDTLPDLFNSLKRMYAYCATCTCMFFIAFLIPAIVSLFASGWLAAVLILAIIFGGLTIQGNQETEDLYVTARAQQIISDRQFTKFEASLPAAVRAEMFKLNSESPEQA